MAAFVEYVIRPMSEDWKIILEQAKQLNLPLTESLLKKLTLAFGLWHLTGEILRALTYIGIAWIVCQTLIKICPILLSL